MNKLIYGTLGAIGVALITHDPIPVWVSWTLLAATFCLALADAYLSTDRYRANLITFLQNPAPYTPYRALMVPLRRRIRRWLRPKVVDGESGFSDFHSKDMESAMTTAYAPMGWTLLDFAVLWAVVYPLILLTAQWGVTGEGRLGQFVVIPAWQHWWEPVFVCVALLLILVSPLLRQRAAHSPRVFLRSISDWLPLCTLAVLTVVIFTTEIENTVQTTFFVAYAIAFSGGLAFAFAFFAPIIGAFANFVATGAAVTVAFALSTAAASLTRNGYAVVGYSLLFCSAATALGGAAFFLPLENMSDPLKGFFLFIGLFPLINGLFDFVSYAITLRLWETGLKKRGGLPPFLSGLLDLGAAALLFTLLGGTLILAVAALNVVVGGEGLMPLGPLFTDLRTGPLPGQSWWDSPQADYIWLYTMMFSTLLPTFLHAGFSCLSLWFPQRRRLRQWYLRILARRDTGPLHEVRAMVLLAVIGVVSFVLPVAGFAGLLMALAWLVPQIGPTYVQIFELLALWLGQIPQIGSGAIPQDWPQSILI